MKRKLLIALAIPFIILAYIFYWKYTYSPICISLAVGSSMEPTIKSGSLVIGLTGRVENGTIVILDVNGQLIIHRVVFYNGTHVITKGDAENIADPITPATKIRCIVKCIVQPPLAIYMLSSLYFILLTLGCAIFYLTFSGFKKKKLTKIVRG